ncbi:hypothetical protein LJC72_01320 [Bacteroides sp. OttesenSCG-928-D19]|nr:hypothetical protein [Bacteroides sp. OttesenSCG-928-N06]MDL2303966.1 hypothetical protein [Bacteroides sp. OttesenSCG-928-D19]
MGSKVVELCEVTQENVHNFTEEEISLLLNKLVSDLPREQRAPYVQIINTAFDFRSISAKSNGLKKDLEMYGYKFFPIPANKKLVMGVRRKTA